jgi:hypothetical protein
MKLDILRKSRREKAPRLCFYSRQDALDYADHCLKDSQNWMAANNVNFPERYINGNVEIVLRLDFRGALSVYDFVLRPVESGRKDSELAKELRSSRARQDHGVQPSGDQENFWSRSRSPSPLSASKRKESRWCPGPSATTTLFAPSLRNDSAAAATRMGVGVDLDAGDVLDEIWLEYHTPAAERRVEKPDAPRESIHQALDVSVIIIDNCINNAMISARKGEALIAGHSREVSRATCGVFRWNG